MTGHGDRLELGEGWGELCMPVSPGESMVAGEVTRTRTASPVTITAIDLAEAESIELVGAFIAPLVDGVGIGSMRLDDPEPGWDQRQPALGATIDDEYVNLLLEVRRVGKSPGRTTSVEVIYETDDGRTFSQRSTTEIVLRDACH